MNNGFVSMAPLDSAFNLHFTNDTHLTESNVRKLEKRVSDLEREVSTLKEFIQELANKTKELPNTKQEQSIFGYIASLITGVFYKEPVPIVESEQTVKQPVEDQQLPSELVGKIPTERANQMYNDLLKQRELETKELCSAKTYEEAQKSFAEFNAERNRVVNKIYVEKINNENAYREQMFSRETDINKKYDEVKEINAKINVIANEDFMQNKPVFVDLKPDVKKISKDVSSNDEF